MGCSIRTACHTTPKNTADAAVSAWGCRISGDNMQGVMYSKFLHVHLILQRPRTHTILCSWIYKSNPHKKTDARNVFLVYIGRPI